MRGLSSHGTELRWIAGLVAGAALVLTPGLFWGLPGGLPAVGAMQILDGGLPYRDFWTMYAPGQFYATAVLFHWFGRELLVAGAGGVALNAISVGAFFWLLRGSGASRASAGVLSIVFLAAVWTTAPALASYEPTRPLLLVGWGFAVRYLRTGRPRRLFLAGVAFGLAACFKHDVAAYAALGTAIALVLAWLLTRDRRPEGWLRPLPAMLWLAAGCALFAVPTVAFLAWEVGADAWRDLVVFPATDFQAVRSEPYPGPIPRYRPLLAWLSDTTDQRVARVAVNGLRAWILGNLPQLAFLVAGTGVWLARRRLEPTTLATALLFLAPLPFYRMAAQVQQNTHLFSMAILSLALGAMAWQRMPRRRGARAGLLVVGVLYAAGLVVHPAMDAFAMVSSWPRRSRLELPGVRGIYVPARSHEAYTAFGELIRERVPEDEAIYVGVTRHAAIVVNDTRIFLLAGRRGATRYPELHPGVTDRAAIQREMIDSIERERVRCVVLWRFGWPTRRLDWIQARLAVATEDGGSTLLDEYLRREFALIARYGEWLVLWRKDAPPASGDSNPTARRGAGPGS